MPPLASMCSEGYHDDLSRPPTVKMDDIKNMNVEEEEEGGWAGHHEDVDYSKEVVFSDSSDEESSGRSVRKSHSSKSVEQPRSGRRGTEVKGDARSRQVSSGQKAGTGEEQPPHSWGSDSPAEKGPPEYKDRHQQHKDHERRHDPDPPQRHEGVYHPYSQRPGPYPPAPQYPHNYHGSYPMYPHPPAFVPRGGHHYPPPPQHVGGGGNRYPPHPHRGPQHKRGLPDRDDGWGQDRDSRGKKKWEEKDIKPMILAKGDKKDIIAHEEPQKSSVSKTPEPLPLQPLQRTVSGSSETQEGGAHVEQADESVELLAEEQLQPTRRGNQPKIMLRKFGDNEGNSSGNRSEGKDRPPDLKNLRQTESKEGEDPGSESASKAKMAWNMKERGPIISPKTLYEPEGKKSADKFKKYHAQIQEPHRGSKSEQDEGTGEGEKEKVKSPVDKEGGVLKGEAEPLKRQDSNTRPPHKTESARTQGRGSPDVANRQGQEFSHQHSREKPQNRKDEPRRPKGGSERRQEASSRFEARSQEMEHRPRTDQEWQDSGKVRERQDSGKVQEREQRPKVSGDRKQEPPLRQDDREPRGKGGGARRQENTEHKGKDAFRREAGQHGGGGGAREKQLSERKNSDQKSREEKAMRRKEGTASGSHGYSKEQEHWDRDKGRTDRKPRKEGGGGRGSIENGQKVSERGSGKRGNEEEAGTADVRFEDQQDSVRHKGQVGGRGAPKRSVVKRDDRKADRGKPPGVKSDRPPVRGTPRANAQASREESQPQRKEKGHPGLGYSELIDIESDSDGELAGAKPTAPASGDHISGRGQQQERRGSHHDEGRVRSAEDSRSRNAGSKPQQHITGSNQNRRPVPRRGDEKRRANRRAEEEEEEEPPRRGGVGRGRGRDRWGESGHSGLQDRPVGEEHRKHEKASMEKEVGGATVEESTSSSSLLEGSGSLQKFDVSRYDLNSHKVAIVDDIGRQHAEEGVVSPTEQADFVEVTSKKVMKERLRKEKEEQRKEEKRMEDQRRKNKSKTQGGVERSSSSVNKPYSAWSTSEANASEPWNAAPGSHLKAGQSVGVNKVPWVPTTAGFALGKGGIGGAKAAMPHTAELVSSTSDTDVIATHYSLFGLYPHFTPSTAPTMLDAAVDSTIGTVTSPRTVTSHSPHIIDQLTPLPLENPLASVESPFVETIPASEPVPVLSAGLKPVENVHPQVHSKGLPPRLKSGAGRGRGSGQRGGGGVAERRDKRRGQVGRSEKHPSSEVIVVGVHYLELITCVVVNAGTGSSTCCSKGGRKETVHPPTS